MFSKFLSDILKGKELESDYRSLKYLPFYRNQVDQTTNETKVNYNEVAIDRLTSNSDVWLSIILNN